MGMILKVISNGVKVYEHYQLTENKPTVTEQLLSVEVLCSIVPFFADCWTVAGGEKKMANLIGMSQEGKVSEYKDFVT